MYAGQTAGLDWPPSVVPVVLCPVEILQQALAGAPGAQLARVVADATDRATELDPDLLAELPDDALADLATACGRLQSWAAGLQARVVAERAARETNPLAHASLVGQVTSELVVTEREATEVVVRAESGTQHPTVIAALVAGRIDVRKAHTLLRSATQLTVAERTEAITRFLPQAPRRTWKWLQTRMLAFAKARHAAGEAARAAAEQRCVQVDRAENDMGWLSAYLPAVDAAAVWGVVDDMAHQLRHVAGEDRTLGQLRADSLTGIVTGRLVPTDRYTATGTSTATGTGADTATSTSPAEATACTCGGRAPVVHETVQVVRITPTRPVVRVTVPAGTLLGLGDAPGDLAGFGPIPADTARLIAEDATWQRLVTDPVTGILTDYSTTTYQPGKLLRAAVQARDETCTFLTCDVPAVRGDLDHVVPFDHDPAARPPGSPGQTRAQNLQPLCRRHHLLKTHAGWGVVRDPLSGVTTWTAPTGRTHARPPTVLDTHVTT
ncbi:HNH endonuclease signature motif containing protein [Promicromonospora aerolata]|uniref:HNH endonuclease n=1 Tax=Promicromonospora aerolata TaxID=195749 RepID=A0ABW4V262_9MICO